MKTDEIAVEARSIYARDRFELEFDRKTGRPTVIHRVPFSKRGQLVAVYALARDAVGLLEVDVLTRAVFEQRLGILDEKKLAREAESYAARKMTLRLIGSPPAARA